MAGAEPRRAFWRFIEHPRTNIIGAIVVAAGGLLAPAIAAYVLFAVAGFLILRSGWEWQPIRSRVPFDIQSPIVWRTALPQKVVPPPAQLGKVDFELYVTRASDAMAGTMAQMGKEMDRNSAEMTKTAAKLQRFVGSSVETRHRALARSAKPMVRHARRMSKHEVQYRAQVENFVSNGRNLVGAFTGQELQEVAAATAAMRQAAEGGKAGTEGYLTTVRGTRDLNLSQAVNGAADALITVLGRIVEDIDAVLTYCQDVADQAARG